MVPPALQATVTVRRATSGLTRFAGSAIHQNVGDVAVVVALEVVAEGGRVATGTTTGHDEAALRRLVAGVAAAAAVRPADPSWPGLCPPSPPLVAPDVHYDRRSAEAGPAERAALVEAFVAAAGGLETAGYCETTAIESVLANTAGQTMGGRATSAAIDGIARIEGADGCGSGCSPRLGDLDAGAAGLLAGRRAREGRSPIELPPGRYEVILEPRAAAYVLDFLAIYGFNARAVAEGRSFATLGEAQFDRALDLLDDAGDPRHLGVGFDREGTPKARTELVSSGVTAGVTHDRRSGAAIGVPSSGHALPGGESVGPVATNLLLCPSPGTVARAPEALVAGVAKGLLVSDFWYARVLDPRSLVVTGLTRNGVFLIRDGTVGPAVSNLRFTQSPVAALGPGAVLGVGNDARLAPGGLHLGWNHAPSLRLAQWNFTGNASG